MSNLETIRDVLIDVSATTKRGEDDIALPALAALKDIEDSMVLVKKTLTTIAG